MCVCVRLGGTVNSKLHVEMVVPKCMVVMRAFLMNEHYSVIHSVTIVHVDFQNKKNIMAHSMRSTF